MIVEDERKDMVPVTVGMIIPAFVKNIVEAFVMFLNLMPRAYYVDLTDQFLYCFILVFDTVCLAY